MTDIVERLREKAPPSAVPSWSDTYRKCVEAADEIERLGAVLAIMTADRNCLIETLCSGDLQEAVRLARDWSGRD